MGSTRAAPYGGDQHGQSRPDHRQPEARVLQGLLPSARQMHGECSLYVGIRVLKVHAAESFGEAALEQLWDKIIPNHTATAAWFERARSCRVVDQAGAVAVLYRNDDNFVCAHAWAAIRGIPPTTADAIDRAVRAGANTWNDGTGRAVAGAARSLQGPLKAAATAWWMTP